MAIKIEYDRESCIGCGTCAAICSDNWIMSSDGKAKLLKTEVDKIGCNQEAADSCPVGCIRITKQ